MNGPDLSSPVDEQLSTRLGRLAVVSTELLQATTVEGVVTVMTDHLAQAVGATVGSVSLLVDSDTFALAGLFGGAADTASRWATYPVDRATPAGEGSGGASLRGSRAPVSAGGSQGTQLVAMARCQRR